ncbi:MAG: hypothetical protein JO147_00065, partial [Actinobacteria bacterium]|nr:hypothetical protein [Actinomycetota bacterium]
MPMAHRRSPFSRPRDPEVSSDPRIRSVIDGLRESSEPDAGSRPDPAFKTELRRQLVAVAPRLIDEGAAEPTSSRTDAAPGRNPLLGRRHGARVRPGRLHLGRPLAVVGTAVVVLTLLLGGSVWISTNALPGDTLYGLKRASESFQLSLQSGDTAKGKQYLQLAQTRSNEVASLVGQSAN